MESYPLELITVMKRRSEDLLIADSDNGVGRTALTFVRDVAGAKTDTAATVIEKGKYMYLTA